MTTSQRSKPQYTGKDVDAVMSIHKIAPDGVCRVRLEWSDKREKWDKHPVAHWPPGSLQTPAHAHWPKLPTNKLKEWFVGYPSLHGIGISCHKFGMLGIDLDEGDPQSLISIIKNMCGAEPLGSATTQRGHRIYYQVKDEERKNPIVGWRLDGYNGHGEILLYTQYDYIWDPISTKYAIMANMGGLYKGPPISIDIFQSTKQTATPIHYDRKSSVDEITAEMIAEVYGLVPNPAKADTWMGACRWCGTGETRFEVTQGNTRPLVRCWVCNIGGTPDVMNAIYKEVRSKHIAFTTMSDSIDHFIDVQMKHKPAEKDVQVDPAPAIPDTKHNQTCDDDITIRTWRNNDGDEVTGAFYDDEQVAQQQDTGGRKIWVLTLPDGQNIWEAVVSIKLTGNKIRKVVFGQYPEFSQDNGKTWKILGDGNEAEMWINVERNVFKPAGKRLKAVSPTRETRKIAMNAMLENIYDPVKEWLENLPEWDNIKRLDTHMADMGMTIKAKCVLDSGRTVDFTNVAQAYIPNEVVRLTYYPGSQRNPMPALKGIGGEGKSSYGERILPPSLQEEKLVTSDYKLTMTGPVAGQLLAKAKICELREFGVDKYSDLNEVKSSALRANIDYRPPWGVRPIKLMRHDVQYVTTNQGNLPEGDPALHRRFFYCILTGKAHTVKNEAWTKLNDIVPGTKYTVREQIFAEAKHRVLNSDNPLTYCECPDLTPEEYMEYNVKMGGSYHTPTEVFQKDVDNTIERLIEDDKQSITMRDMKAAIVCVEHSRDKIMTAEELEIISESSIGGSDGITKAGAKEVLKRMSAHRNDSVQQAVQKNAEYRVLRHGQEVVRYTWRRGANKGKGQKRLGFQFRLIGNIDPTMVQYGDIVEAAEKIRKQGLEVTESRMAEHLQIDERSIEDSAAWDRYLTYHED